MYGVNTLKGVLAGCEHFLTFKNHGVLVVMDSDIAALQRGLDRSVARQRGGVVVVVEKHRLGLNLGRQLHDFVARRPIFDHEAAAPGLQDALQFADAGVDEFDAAVGRVGERIQYFAVENKGADDLACLFQRMVKRGVVVVAQVAAKPDEGAGVFRHGLCWSL